MGKFEVLKSEMSVMTQGRINGICCKANTQLINSKEYSLKEDLAGYYQLDEKFRLDILWFGVFLCTVRWTHGKFHWIRFLFSSQSELLFVDHYYCDR